MIVSTFSGNMLSGKTFEIFFPALFMMLLAPRNIEPKPIANEKIITTKPINSDENQACCGAKGPISLLANVSIVKLGESMMPVSAKVKVKIKELNKRFSGIEDNFVLIRTRHLSLQAVSYTHLTLPTIHLL